MRSRTRISGPNVMYTGTPGVHFMHVSAPDTERISLNRLVPTALLDEANVPAADINRFVSTTLLDEANIQAADVNRLLVTLVVDETYP